MMTSKHTIKLVLILLIFAGNISIYSQVARSNKVAFLLDNLPDSIPPTIKILYPVLNGDMSFQSKVDQINLTGEVKDDGAVRFIALNSVKLAFTASGVFTTGIELHPGKNEIRLVAADVKNNLQEKFIFIEYLPPFLNLETNNEE